MSTSSRYDDISKQGIIWPYSPQYNTIIGEGFNRPHPQFGAPTLVWHIGLWQNLTSDQAPRSKLDDEDDIDKLTDDRKRLKSEYASHDSQTWKFYREISELLTSLQSSGRQLDAELETLQFQRPKDMPGSTLDPRFYQDGKEIRPHIFRAVEPQSIDFTLWWQDSASRKTPNQRQARPADTDIRVHVQFNTYIDHATLTFFIDVSKAWSTDPVYSLHKAIGQRRRKIFQHIHDIQESSKDQIKNNHTQFDFVPETGVNTNQAENLLDAADYLYEDIWSDFVESFNLTDYSFMLKEESAAIEGRRFADFRGLVMSVDEIEQNDERKWVRSGQSEPESVNINETFDEGTGEPNQVLRSYWPFFRRAIPWADYRDIVACGLINFRALYMTSQKSAAPFHEQEETSGREYEVPAQNLSKLEAAGIPDNRPIRYLILTKGKPHRGQIGRFVEHLNYISSSRMFALKSWPAIRNASHHIRILGRELDGIFGVWNSERQKIDESWKTQCDKLIHRKRWWCILDRFREKKRFKNIDSKILDELEEIPEKARLKIDDERVEQLSMLISHTEKKLILLSASLDEIGHGGSGRLLYVIKRSEDFIQEFHEIVGTLQMKNVDTWMNYDQFIQRGLKPTFDYIKSTGQRLVALRKRLEVVTDTIQTSALIVEAEATRANTQTLRMIVRNFWVLIAVYGIAGVPLKIGDKGESSTVLNWAIEAAKEYGPMIMQMWL